jgi:hypothetical protein
VEHAVIVRGFATASIAAWLLACELCSQSLPQSPLGKQPQHSSAQERQDRSFYLGTPVTHPEDLSGLWEAPDGHGGAIGIHLLLDTTAPVDANTLTGVTQSWLGLQLGIYQRSGAELRPGDENFFSDSPRGGSLRYEGGRLTLHAPGYDLDLHRIAEGNEDKWSGRFHRGDIDSVVTLARPMLRPQSKNTWFLGTWKGAAGPQVTCLHIAQASPPALLAWSDSLVAWGAARFAPHVAKPPYSWEHYGDLVKIQPAENGALWVELGAYSAICCSHRFHATSADNGKAMKSDWPAGPNQSPHKSRWTKMSGNSCIAPAPQ